MPLNSSVRENGEIVVTSGDRLTIESAAEFSRVINEALMASKNVTLEFESALEIDITGLQVLCSSCKSAANSGKVFASRGQQPQTLIDLIAASGSERHSVCKYNNNSNCIWFGGSN